MIRAGLLVAALLAALPAWSATLAEVDRLWEAREIDRELAESTDGVALYIAEIDEEMLAGQGGPDWQARARAIFDRDEITRDLRATLADELSSAEVAALLTVGEHRLGVRWTEAMLAAQHDLIDPDDMQAAVADLAQATGARRALIERVRAGLERDPYVDQMVAANLNYYTAFLRGALADGAFGPAPSEAMLVDLVRGQSAAFREHAFVEILALSVRAAETFTPAEYEELVSLKATPDAEAAYGALFSAYESAFVPRYAALGAELSRFALEDSL